MIVARLAAFFASMGRVCDRLSRIARSVGLPSGVLFVNLP